MMSFRRRKGFTLIEMVVATTIFSIVAVAIGASIVSGLRIWDNIKNVDFARANFLLDLDRIAGDLYGAVDVPVIGFEGKDVELSFPAISGDSLIKASYVYDRDKKILMKRETGYKEILSEKKEKAYTEKEVLAPESCDFAYYGFNDNENAGEWTALWTKEDGVFKAVKITVKFKGEEFVKTVFVPVSTPR